MSNKQLQEKTVFVQNLKEGITQEELYQIFISFGEIKSIEIPMTKENKTRGLAFIEFDDQQDAKEAMYNLDQAELFGKKPKNFKEDKSKPVWESQDTNIEIQQDQIQTN